MALSALLIFIVIVVLIAELLYEYFKNKESGNKTQMPYTIKYKAGPKNHPRPDEYIVLTREELDKLNQEWLDSIDEVLNYEKEKNTKNTIEDYIEQNLFYDEDDNEHRDNR